MTTVPAGTGDCSCCCSGTAAAAFGAGAATAAKSSALETAAVRTFNTEPPAASKGRCLPAALQASQVSPKGDGRGSGSLVMSHWKLLRQMQQWYVAMIGPAARLAACAASKVAFTCCQCASSASNFAHFAAAGCCCCCLPFYCLTAWLNVLLNKPRLLVICIL